MNEGDITQGRNMIGFLGRVFGACFMALLLLSLLSFHAEDSTVLEGGVGAYVEIENWIGRFGAWFSQKILYAFGLASYPTVALLLLASTVRLMNQPARKITLSYLLGIGLFLFGLSMVLGNFPNFMKPLTTYLNLSQIPGGVLGQRLCAPASAQNAIGWISNIVNSTGALILTGTMTATGLYILFFYDYQLMVIKLWKDYKERQASQPTIEEETEPEVAIESLNPEPEEFIPEPEPKPKAVKAPIIKRTAQPVAIKNPKSTPVTSAPPAQKASSDFPNYRLPSTKLLNQIPSKTGTGGNDNDVKKQVLQQTMESFGIDAKVVGAMSGPRVTLFEIRPAPGVKVEKISSLQNNIAMSLKAESLRILTPIPGKDSVGIEVPNSSASAVHFRELLQSPSWRDTKGSLPICLGKDISGKPEIMDLARAPHLLIAGATGAGKSVCMNTLIMSLLFRFRPDELKLILVDPKVVEFTAYASLPHLVTPVISDVKKVPQALNWAVNEMERRYRMLAKIGSKNIAGFNARKPEAEPVMDEDGNPIPNKLPYIVVIIDELADIMMTSKQEIETLLARIAQKARAIGIHAVIATQRPSVNVITGVIKANFPTRIAFQVTSITDSRTILDVKGAEALLGRGDMLYKPPSGSKLSRTQGCLVDDDEIDRVISFISEQAEAEFVQDMFKEAKPETTTVGGVTVSAPPDSDFSEGDEELIQQAIGVILQDKRATTSYIQRKLRIGYNKASIIIEELERRGVVGPQIGSAPRDILIGDNEGAGASEASEQPADSEA
ncbi:MAG: DNA translocase FtsK [Lentisphaeria bacterium]|nr:DNA translocase FtsK [Lentisphaeria bacterium]